METRRDNLQLQYLWVITFAEQIEIHASIERIAQCSVSAKMQCIVQEFESRQSFLISPKYFLGSQFLF